MPEKQLTEKPETLASLLASPSVQKRFSDVLGTRSAAFTASLLSLQNMTPQLQQSDPRSILSAAMVAATLDLPVNRNLGYSAIIPYGKEAQFQIMARGFVQLGLRSGQYKNIHVTEVYKDEIQKWNPLTSEFEATDQATWKMREEGKPDNIAGYLAYMKLHNGFEKYVYWTIAQVTAHAKKFSKSFSNPNGQWLQNFDAMAKKTMVKLLLSKWGVLSVQMEKAIDVDQAVVDTTGEIVAYPDRAEEVPVATKPNGADKKINEDQFKLMMARAAAAGIEKDEINIWVKQEFKKEHLHDITVEELTKVLKWMEQNPEAK
jgi:recombination protein RecT